MKSGKLILLLYFTLSIIINGCQKDSIDPEVPEIKDRWELIPLANIGIHRDYPYHVRIGTDDQLYAIQRYGGSRTECFCQTQSGTWKRFAVDSLNSIVNLTSILRTQPDGTLWILTDTRLAKVTACGTFESYTVAGTDSLTYSNSGNRFVGLEIIDGIPWLLHARWGLFHYDFDADMLVHHPILQPFPFYNDLSEIGNYESLAVDNDGIILFNNHDGRAWLLHHSGNISALENPICYDCKYHYFRTNPSGGVNVDVTDLGGVTRTLNLQQPAAVPTLPLYEAPNYFSNSVFDRNGYLAYYSNTPNFQPYIGLQPNGVGQTVVNARDAVQQGNVIVYDLAFNAANVLYAATDQGVIKYLGKDE